MIHLFDPENKFWSFLNKIIDTCCIGFLWFVTSLPIVTIGAATTSLYQFTLKQADDEEGYVWKSFWKAFVKNFRKATAIWLLVLIVMLFLLVDIWVCINAGMPGGLRILCLAVLLSLAFIVIFASIYVFPILSRFEFSVKKLLIDSLAMAIGNLYVSITILTIDMVMLILTWHLPVLFPFLVALAAFVNSYFLRFVFSRYWTVDETL